MNLNLNLPKDVETRLIQSAAASGKDVESYLKQLITEQMTEPDLERTDDITLPSPELFAERQAAWVKLHPVLDHAIDDSRKSFYKGRE